MQAAIRRIGPLLTVIFSRRHALRLQLFQQIHRQQHVAVGVVKLHDADLDQPHRHVAVDLVGSRRIPAVVDQNRLVDLQRAEDRHAEVLEASANQSRTLHRTEDPSSFLQPPVACLDT